MNILTGNSTFEPEKRRQSQGKAMTTLDCTLKQAQKFDPTLIASTISLQTGDELQARQERSICEECHLRSLCLSKTLDADGLEELNRVVRHHRPVRKGQHLFRQEDEFKSLFVIRAGAAKSYRTSIDGEELGVSFFLPGEMLGLDGLYRKKYTNSVIALEDMFVCEFPFRALEKLLVTQPLMQRHFNELQSLQILQEQEMLLLHSQKTADGQLAAFLINLSQRQKRLKLSPVSFRLPMTRKDIASCLGLASETMSRLFANFQRKSWVNVKGREITLTNMSALCGFM